jgi:N-acetyl-gamma-glutamylphosphate reductase
MKLIVAGSTGFLATEIIRQALAHPGVTSVLALARRETPIPKNLKLKADSKKLKSVVCQDFGNYSEEVKRQLAGADACIWRVLFI